MPVQRLPRLEMLLSQLVKHNVDDAAKPKLIEALDSIKNVAEYCNDKKRNADQQYRIHWIALEVKNIPRGLPLLEPHRRIVHEGLTVVQGSQKLYRASTYLFNDLIMWAAEPSPPQVTWVYRGHIMLTAVMRVVTLVEENDLSDISLEGGMDPSLAFIVEWSQMHRRRIFFADSDLIKREWVSKLEASRSNIIS